MEYRTQDALCGVYKITNLINNKVYIGQSINIESRWNDHINALNRGDSSCTLLQRAWNKYKQEYFSFEILELCSEDDLDDVEIKYINFYDSVNNGYNIEPGGNKNKHLSEETKQKIGNANRGRIISDERRLKMSESRTGDKNPMYGKTHSKEARNKISEARKGKPGYPRSDYQKECARLANLGKEVSEETRKKISEANKGSIPHNKNFRPVYCIELNRVFENASFASKELHIHSSNILGCCEYIRKTCGGYHWMYADTNEYNEFILSLITQI
jgi:group I intron endonuclease